MSIRHECRCNPKAHEAFKRAVKQLGGSKAAALALGVSRSYVDMVRSAYRCPSRLSTLRRIEEVLKIPVSQWAP